MSQAPKESEKPDESVDRARRRLLRLSAYVAPAVIGTMLTTRAKAQQPSCGPSQCGPQGGPCGPNSCGPRL